MSNGTHNVAFAFGETCGVLPVSAVTGTVTVTVQAKPDLVITALTTDKSAYPPGAPVKVAITIRNQSNTPTGALTTIYRLGNFSSCKPEGLQEKFGLSSLAPGATQTFNGSFNAPSASGQYTINAMTDAYCQIDETSESNNRRSVGFTVSP